MVTLFDVFRFSQKENRLTAQLMLTLEEFDRNQLLRKFLDRIGFGSLEDLDSVKFELQEAETDSIPDATAYLKRKKIFFVESKLGSDISEDQVISHLDSGKREIPVLCITRGIRRPEGIEKAIEETHQGELIKWLSWRDIHGILTSLPVEFLKTNLISSMIRSLESEGLVGYTGIKQAELRGIPEFVTRYIQVTNKIPQLMEDVEFYMIKKDPDIVRSKFWRDGRAQKSVDAISFCDYAYSYPTWASCGYYSTLPWVDKEGSFAAIKFGFDQGVLSVWGRIALGTMKRITSESWRKIFDELTAKNFKARFLTRKGETVYATDLTNFLEEIEASKEYKAVDFYLDYGFNDFLSKRPSEVVKSLGEHIVFILRLFKQEKAFSTKEIEEEEGIPEES